MRNIILLSMLVCFLNLFSQQTMELVWSDAGVQECDNYGYTIAALDFNGDGYDDLAVSAPSYMVDVEVPQFRGKLYLYWGSPNGLSETCSLSISTVVDSTKRTMNSWRNIINLGDMNGDGCEDLGYSMSYGEAGSYQSFYYISVLFGNTVNDTIPDFQFQTSNSLPEVFSLGDINGDNYDDMAVMNEGSYRVSYYVIMGNTFETITLVENRYQHGHININGLGDLNADGFADFYYHYIGEGVPQPDGSSLYPHHHCLFYGSAVQDTLPDIHLLDFMRTTSGQEFRPLGDFNGDGYDDFIGSETCYEDGDELGKPIWRGGETIHWDWIGYLECDRSRFYPSIGDLNGDGYSDLIIASAERFWGFLGGRNGTEDIYQLFQDHEDFFPRTDIGDFNGDGYDDVAIGADGDAGSSDHYYGSALVFAGREGLMEQDPYPIDDQSAPQPSVTFQAFPNPFNPEICFDIQVPGCHEMQLEFFNVRGQKVDAIKLDSQESTVTWKPEKLATGIYMCRLKADGKEISRKKITLMK